MSGTEPDTNVMPMHHIHHWKPPARPTPQPPSCFSELARLNQCYDDVQAMKQILSKVMADLIQNDPAIVKSIIEEISKAGTSVPILGVTDGSDAQPGQVGEYLFFSEAFPIPSGNETQSVSLGILPPGDWDVFVFATPSAAISVLYYWLNPLPAGFSTNAMGYQENSAGTTAATVSGIPTRGLISNPTLMAFNIWTDNTGAAATANLYASARRAR